MITAGNSTVRGLVINRFDFTAITLKTAGGNRIEGNFLGTNADGTASGAGPSGRQHEFAAINIEDSPNNIIGGLTPAERNVISGNGSTGLGISGTLATGVQVLGNYIGTGADGASDLGNLAEGLSITGGASGNTVSNNTVAFNDGDGVYVASDTFMPVYSINNRLTQNRIHSNAGLGIDLEDDGVTPNDAGDADPGANKLQNFPAVTSASSGGGGTVVGGTLDSASSTNYIVEFFANDSCNGPSPDDYGEGQTYLGSHSVTTDAGGHAVFSASLPTPLNAGQFVTATATDPDGNTSEFSRCFLPGANGADLSVEKTASANPAFVDRIFSYNISVSNDGPGDATGVQLTDTLPSGPSFISATPSQGTCTHAGLSVNCDLGSIPNGQAASIQIRVKPRASGMITNSVSVSANETDSDTSNNTDSVDVNVLENADLELTKTDTADPLIIGASFSYNLNVTNHGPQMATNVVLTDTLPAGVALVSAPPACAHSLGVVTCQLGNIPKGGSSAVAINVQVAGAGTLVNTASVASDQGDSNPENNSTGHSTRVIGLYRVLLSETTVSGGCQHPTGNVYLTSPAPSGGLTVNLSSTNAAASVPATVFVPAGSTVSDTFNVTTSEVTRRTTGSIKATLGSQSVGRSLLVEKGCGGVSAE